MTRTELTQHHWRYYLLLEKRFIESTEYVELHKENFTTFSNAYAFLIQAIGAELDTVFKVFCRFDTNERKTISDYAQYIIGHVPNIKDVTLEVREHDIKIQPFENWDHAMPAQSLAWWSAFVGIKHDRYQQMQGANLENALNILGALCLIEMLYLREITDGTDDLDIFDNPSTLFTFRNWTSKAVPMDEVFTVLNDLLDDSNSVDGRKFDV